MVKEILKFIALNPALIAQSFVVIVAAVVIVLGRFGLIKAATVTKAKAMLLDGKTVSEITDVTSLIVPEVQKIAVDLAAAQKK